MKDWFDGLTKQSVMGKKPKIETKDKIINDIWRLFDT